MTSVTDEVMKTKQETGLNAIDGVQEIIYAEMNGHVTEDIARPNDKGKVDLSPLGA